MATMDSTILKSASGFDLTPPSADERARLEAGLSQEEREVLLRHGTEAPFCGGLLGNKQDGVYCCRLCGLPLFLAKTKFESGTGWPSFWAPYDEGHIRAVRDFSHGMIRIETRCARCDSHQGHMFPDGPPPTGLRYCINCVSLSFVAAGDPLPDPLKRADLLS
jgi:peptide-methionine (R)-S-oxide reductase